MKTAFRKAGRQLVLMEALRPAVDPYRLTGMAVMKVGVTWIVVVERRREVTLAVALRDLGREAGATLEVVATQAVVVTSQAVPTLLEVAAILLRPRATSLKALIAAFQIMRPSPRVRLATTFVHPLI